MPWFVDAAGWRRAALAILVVLSLAGAGHAAAQPVARFGPDAQSLALQGHMALLTDEDGQLSLEQVMAPPMRDRFKILPLTLSMGYTPTTAWLRFTLENTRPAPRRLYLEFEPAFIDHIDVYVPRNARPGAAADFHEVRLGDHVRIADKPVYNLNNVLPVDLPAGESREFFVRAQTSSSLMLRATLRTDRNLERSSTRAVAALGLYVGVAAVVCLINLIFWRWVRQPAYLWYAIYVFTLGGFSAAGAGVTPLLFPDHPEWSDLTVGSLNYLSCASAGMFALTVLEFRTRAPVLYRLYQAFALYGVLGVVALFFGYYQRIVGPLNLVALILLFVAVAQSYRMARQGFRPAQLFVLSFAAQLIGLSSNILRVIGLLPTMEWTDYSYQAASAVHMILMNIGLAQRMKEADAKAHAAQAEALALAQQSESRAQAIAVERTRDFEAALVAAQQEKERAEAALAAEQEAQRAQVRFIDVITHQYRTPLSVIEINAEGIGMSLPGEDGTNRRRIDRIRRAVSRLVAMIDVSLNRSRLEGAPLAPRLRRIALAGMLRQAVQRVRDSVGDRVIDLTVDDMADDVEVLCDPEMIELALTNLIENAIKFSGADQPVHVAVDVGTDNKIDMLCITVRDSGIGIPRAEIAHIFQKFYRATNASDRPGVGIGLQLVAQLVRAQGGKVMVSSVEERGSSFTIALPLAYSPAAE